VFRYATRRLLSSLPVFFCVITIVFFVVRVLPGDPAQAALGDYASREAVEALRTQLGLDAPLPVQYARFLGDLAHGDLGTSMINGASIRDSVAYNLPFTLQLAIAALVLGIVLGVPIGVYSAVHHDRPSDHLLRLASLTGLSVPAFFLGVLIMLLFGVQLRWFPAIGGGDPDQLQDRLTYLVLPTLSLGLVMTASVAHVTRSAMLGALPQEYVRTARAKGLREHLVLTMYVLRPALLPIVSLTGIWAVALVGDSVTTEVVFARPGLGRMIVGAILQRDYTALQSVMVIYTLFVVGINLVTDLAYGIVDPRTRS